MSDNLHTHWLLLSISASQGDDRLTEPEFGELARAMGQTTDQLVMPDAEGLKTLFAQLDSGTGAISLHTFQVRVLFLVPTGKNQGQDSWAAQAHSCTGTHALRFSVRRLSYGSNTCYSKITTIRL